MLIKRRGLVSGAAALAAYAGLPKGARAQSCGNFYPSSAPAPASALGYSKLLFADDFNVANTISPDTTSTKGYNWFLASNATSSNASVNTTATAASISNGNTGPGGYASGNGGILSLNGPNAPGNGNVTIFSTPIGTQKVSNPGFGCWGPNVYFEVYAQFNPSFTANNQWFAPLWHFSQVLNGTKGEEIDLIENYAGNFGYSSTNSTFAGHEWNGSTQVAGGGGSYGTGLGASWVQIKTDAEWHAYGWSWVSTGTNTGNIQVFYDNSPVVLYNNNAGTPYSSSVLSVGSGGTAGFQYLDNSSPLYAIMGGPPGTTMNIDYMRVWSA